MRLTKEEVEGLHRNVQRFAAIRFVDRVEPLCEDNLSMRAKLEGIGKLLLDEKGKPECCCEMIEPCIFCQIRGVLV